MSKSTLALAALLLLGNGVADAQIPASVTDLPAKGFMPDLAVPDAPAFDLLGTEPTTLLRPGSVHDLAISLSEFVGPGGSFRLPTAFAVEFSPALLMAPDSLAKKSYEDQKALYAFRISAAVLTDTASDGLSRMALGLRYTFRNEADLRGDEAFLHEQQVTPITRRILEIYQEARDDVGPNQALILSPAQEERIEELQEQIRERWAERYWNASGIDFALGIRGSTLDATGTDPRVTAYGVWGSWAEQLSGWGQVLLGVHVGGERSRDAADMTQLVSIAARLNLGTNAYKVFASLDDKLRESQSAELQGRLGVELRINDWVWGVLTLGFRDLAGTAASEATFKLNTAFPRL